MEANEVSRMWEEDTWDNLVPRLQSRYAAYQANIEQAKREYPEDDFSEWNPLMNGWLWLPAVAEAMRSRPELLVYHPIMLSHATIRLPYGGAELWVDATANNHFTARRVVAQGNGRYDITPICEGDAEQMAECVAAFLRQYAE